MRYEPYIFLKDSKKNYNTRNEIASEPGWSTDIVVMIELRLHKQLHQPYPPRGGG